jgi:hypothetical protein
MLVHGSISSVVQRSLQDRAYASRQGLLVREQFLSMKHGPWVMAIEPYDQCRMHRTRLSLFYLAGYLTFAGLALLLVPTFALRLLLSNGHYGEVFPRLAGMLLLGLAVLIIQIIRHRIDALYPTTLALRLFFLVVLAYLFVTSGDPFFMIVFGIVALGVLFTGYAYLSERRAT